MNNVDPLKVARAFMDDRYGSLGDATKDKDEARTDKWLENFGHTIDAMTYLVEAQNREPVPAAVTTTHAEESRKVQQEICEGCALYNGGSSKTWHCKLFTILQPNCGSFERSFENEL